MEPSMEYRISQRRGPSGAGLPHINNNITRRITTMKIQIKGLTARIEDTPILNGIDLEMESGKIHALMGPNGSGKSTLSNVI
ncbi:MAG: ATP-binding cassette domain-containing protein, partial [Spirochaeta sp.]